jgi:hypothetical protein
VLGYVSDPQLVPAAAGELPVDEVDRGWLRPDPRPLGAAADAVDAGAAHQHLHRAMADTDAVAQRELGVHPAAAVGTARALIHMPDQVGQPHVPDHPRRRGARPRQA